MGGLHHLSWRNFIATDDTGQFGNVLISKSFALKAVITVKFLMRKIEGYMALKDYVALLRLKASWNYSATSNLKQLKY